MPINSTKNKESAIKKIGKPHEPVKTFTKDDFLTKRFLAAKFKESADLIEKTLKYIRLHNNFFMVNGHKTPIVTDSNTKYLRVHPLAMDIFKEHLEQQKKK